MRFTLFIILVNLSPLYANPNEFKSTEAQTHLLELFSTQSCSSCPSAQKWISHLVEDNHVFKTFVPVVYHVDYWDYLGWKDPFSKRQFTERQHDYAAFWKTDTLYTPEFVLNGREWKSQNQTTLNKNGPLVGVLQAIRVNDYTFQVSFVSIQAHQVPLTFQAVLLGNKIQIPVTAGENRGKTLPQDAITLEHFKLTPTFEKGSYQSQIKFNSPNPLYANHLSVAFWVSKDNGHTPIQATGGYLLKGQLKR